MRIGLAHHSSPSTPSFLERDPLLRTKSCSVASEGVFASNRYTISVNWGSRGHRFVGDLSAHYSLAATE